MSEAGLSVYELKIKTERLKKNELGKVLRRYDG